MWCEHDESLTTYDFLFFRYKLNVWDVGGQKSLRSYWRNYFESTDGLIWVVDSADKRRLDDCRKELHALLREEVYYSFKQFMQFKIITENICYDCGLTFKRSLIGNVFTLFKYYTDISPKHLLMTKKAFWFQFFCYSSSVC